MADRFPSLEEFDEDIHTDVRDAPVDGGSFLERERAVLGDEAGQFEQPGDNFMSTVEEAGDDDLLGGGGNSYQATAGNGDDMADFESSFPTIDSTQLAPGGTIGSSSFLPGAPTSNYGGSQAYNNEPEPAVITAWREQRNAEIETRDKISAEKTQSTIAEAQQAINDFYDNFNDKKEKNVAQVRREAEEFLAGRDDTTSGGTSWERIAKLVDLSGKGVRGGAGGSGKERMREMLLSLRKDENAPGAKGY